MYNSSCLVLSRFRRARSVHVLQLLVFTAWVLNPFPGAWSYYTDINGDGVKEEVANPTEGDAWYDQDADADGLSNALEAGLLVPGWSSDPYALDSERDGLADSVEYQYCAAALAAGTALPYDPWAWDTNLDGFSDFDQFYQQIQSYNPVVNYNNRTPGSFFSYFDANGNGVNNPQDNDPLNMDLDNDGILNWNEAAGQMNDPTNGYTPPPPVNDPGVMIGGTWYPTGTLDSDGDNIVDAQDPFPWGSFWYLGTEYGGAWSDRDNDAVPDQADSFPDGSFWYNGFEYGGAWEDRDGDGVPTICDSWPDVAGSFWYNNTQYPGYWYDSDNDSVPDSLDAFPWVAGSYWYLGTEYAGPWLDQDNDGVPDA